MLVRLFGVFRGTADLHWRGFWQLLTKRTTCQTDPHLFCEIFEAMPDF
jgi:hypothetical protein